MKNKTLKYFIDFLIIIVVLIIVLYFSLKDNYHEIINNILNVKGLYLVLAFLAFVGYRACASLAHYFIIKANDEHVPFLRMLQINFIILFFHGVTPFATGGQPMEVYYLHNEKIGVTKGTNITLQNFIVYQISLVLFGIIALLYNLRVGIFPRSHLINKLVVLGFTVNLFVLLVSFILSFSKKITTFISTKGIDFLYKLKLIKDEKETKEKLNKYLSNFHDNALKLKYKKKIVLLTIFVNLIGLLSLYSMPYIIGCGLHVNINYVSSVVATAYVMIIGGFVPIPGGTGGIEYAFVFFFNYLIGAGIVNAIMLIWRSISYYLGIIIGGITLMTYRKKD